MIDIPLTAEAPRRAIFRHGRAESASGSRHVGAFDRGAATSQKLANGPAQRRDWLGLFVDRLNLIAELKAGWNGYDAPPPKAIAIHYANDFLTALHTGDLEPTRLAPSVVGGVGITIRRDSRKVYIEFYNDGSTYVLFSDGADEAITRPVGAEKSSYDSLVSESRDYLHA